MKVWLAAWALAGALVALTPSAAMAQMGGSALSSPGSVPSLPDIPYNLKLGQVNLRFSSSVSTSFSDNINVAKYGRQADMYVTPTFGVDLLWQATEGNSLHFAISAGYVAYLEHSQYNGLVISPSNASQLQYNIFVGDVKLNVHDTFSYLQDPLSVGQLSNSAQFARFVNSAGVGADWDLNGDIILSLDYEHSNLWVFESAYEYLNSYTDTVTPQVSWTINPTLTTGFSASFSATHFHENIQNNSTGVNFGPFVNTEISDNLSLHAAVGASLSNFASGGLNGDLDTENYTYTASAGLNHRINDMVSETLTVGREVIPGLTSNYTDRVYANYGNTWQITPTLSLGTSLWWENLEDSQAIFREDSNRYGVTLGVSHSITDKLSANLSYQYVLKVANPSDQGYYQDLVTLGLAYQF